MLLHSIPQNWSRRNIFIQSVKNIDFHCCCHCQSGERPSALIKGHGTKPVPASFLWPYYHLLAEWSHGRCGLFEHWLNLISIFISYNENKVIAVSAHQHNWCSDSLYSQKMTCQTTLTACFHFARFHIKNPYWSVINPSQSLFLIGRSKRRKSK